MYSKYRLDQFTEYYLDHCWSTAKIKFEAGNVYQKVTVSHDISVFALGLAYIKSLAAILVITFAS